MKLCWRKLDRKSKKVNFLITQANAHLEDKATASTIEEVGERIEGLQFKLDEISLNIVSQVETEKVHFECKSNVIPFSRLFLTRLCFANVVTQDTASQQTWMNLLKMLLVLVVCGG